jgi:GntR family transcriptional regulator/MocR family aminotransferase
VNSILEGHLPPQTALPSSRKLARQLGVARNTVVHAYQHLVDEGFLVSRERSGFYVNADILRGRVQDTVGRPHTESSVNWAEKIVLTPGSLRQNLKPSNWQRYPYPFICGQYDQQLFPITDWRECCREAAAISAIHEWAGDQVDQDHPRLLDEIHRKLLPRRGVWADREEILVTTGAQQGIYLAAALLLDSHRTIGFESPGYVDAEHSFGLFTRRMTPLPLDAEGLVPGQAFRDCDCVYVTPSHQYPTTVTMPRSRRQELLEMAGRHDIVVIEDDYESEFNYVGEPTPALKSLDEDGRVIYVGSLSKTLAPGIRLGFMVAPPAFIDQARALRRLMMRHPPSNNQYIVAEFFKRGYHDALVNRLGQTLHRRWQLLGDLLERHMPGGSRRPAFGGSAIWVEGDPSLDAGRLLQRAAVEGILFEPGEVFFHGDNRPKHYFRLGFSSIPTDHIEPGIEKLVRLMRR